MKPLIIFTLLMINNITRPQTVALPSWFLKYFNEYKLGQKYEISTFLKPSFLQADFNGDKLLDIAVFVYEKQTKKKGILIIHDAKKKYFIFGAGIKFESGSDNFKWADGWKVYRAKTRLRNSIRQRG